MIEALLLLLWRHLLYYTSDSAVQPSTLSLNFSVGVSSTANVKGLQKVAASLRGVLERLDDEGDAYSSMLVRRLRELCAGLVPE